MNRADMQRVSLLFKPEEPLAELQKDLGPEGRIDYKTATLAQDVFEQIKSGKCVDSKLEFLAEKIEWKVIERTTQTGVIAYLNKVCSAITNFFVHWDFKEAVSSDHLLLRSLSPERTKGMLVRLMGWHDRSPLVPYQDCHDLVDDIKKFFLSKIDQNGEPFQELKNRGFTKKDLEELFDQVALFEKVMKTGSIEEIGLDALPQNLKSTAVRSILQDPIWTVPRSVSVSEYQLPDELDSAALNSFNRVSAWRSLREDPVSHSGKRPIELSRLESLFDTTNEETKRELQSYMEEFISSNMKSITSALDQEKPLRSEVSIGDERNKHRADRFEGSDGSVPFAERPEGESIHLGERSTGSPSATSIEPTLSSSERDRVEKSLNQLMELVQFCSADKKEKLVEDILDELAKLGSEKLINAVSHIVGDRSVSVLGEIKVISKLKLGISGENLEKLIASCVQKICKMDFTEKTAESLLDILSKPGEEISLFKKELLKRPATQAQVDQLLAFVTNRVIQAEDKGLDANQKIQFFTLLQQKIEGLGDWQIEVTTALVEGQLTKALRELFFQESKYSRKMTGID